MTWVKSRLVLPDGSPVRGAEVTATVMTGPNWLHDDGRTIGNATTHTGRDGMWFLNLMPYTQVEPPTDAHMYYQVNEGGQAWNIRVPPPPEPPPDDWPPNKPWSALWLRDLIFDEAPPAKQTQLWQLSGLADVAGEVATAPDGTALVKRGGMWRVLPYELAALADVDPATVANPVVGAPLVWLGSERGWGQLQAEPEPPTPAGQWRIYDPGPGADPSGYTVRLELVDRDPERAVTVDWGDGGPVSTLSPEQTTTDHTYMPMPGGYPITATYTDGEPLEPATSTDDWCEVPYPRGE